MKTRRPASNILPFAYGALGNERTTFGTTEKSDELEDNLNANLYRGWGIVGANDFPPKQWFNALLYTIGGLLSHVYQNGIPEWTATQEYYIGGITNYGGNIFVSLTGSDTTPNKNKQPDTSPLEWIPLKKNIGLGNVDNTSDLAKPISTATQTALDGKQPKGDYAEGNHKHQAAQVTFTDGLTFQQKLDNGSLRGQQGEQGLQGVKGDNGISDLAAATGVLSKSQGGTGHTFGSNIPIGTEPLWNANTEDGDSMILPRGGAWYVLVVLRAPNGFVQGYRSLFGIGGGQISIPAGEIYATGWRIW